MKKAINDTEFKALLLKEMEFFHSFCEANGIQYFLFYGSMLGAVRHQGFIPWDDDIDLVMSRKDYYKLVELFNDASDRYKLVSMHNTPDFTAPLAKIIDTKTELIQNYGFRENVDLGIYLDIFILDGLPQNQGERQKYMKKAKQLTRKWMYSNQVLSLKDGIIIANLLRYFLRLPYRMMGYKYYLKKIDMFASKYDFDHSEYVTNLSLTTVDYEYRREDFEPLKVAFEDKYFYIPKGYERLLTQRYGDWRKPPEISSQKSHHKYQCYYR